MKLSIKIIVFILLSFSSLNAQTWNEIIKNVASDRAAGDRFGTSVCISGNTAIVGAYYEDEDELGNNTLLDAGAAYIFELKSGTWKETAKLVASDRASEDFFGHSVSISGTTAIIGAPREDEDSDGLNSIPNTGSVYVFELQSGNWTETAKLTVSERAEYDNFGYSLDIDNDKIIIGAEKYGDTDINGDFFFWSGAAYIFELQSNIWTETAKLLASDRADGDYFGVSVGISGNTAVVGAEFEDEDSFENNTLDNTGSTYVFELQSGVWSETTKLVASDREFAESFGKSVDIDGDKIIIGAPYDSNDDEDGNYLASTGSAYIFELQSGVWTETTKLLASDYGYDDSFGNSVKIENNRVIIGAYRDDENAYGDEPLAISGSVYLFELQSGIWNQTFKLDASDRDYFDSFGWCVGLSGDKIIVGAIMQDESGAAYIFEYDPNGIYVSENYVKKNYIYPNPTKEYITLHFEEIVDLFLTDINGKILHTENMIPSNYIIDMSTYRKGVYFLSVSNKNGKSMYKIIKK